LDDGENGGSGSNSGKGCNCDNNCDSNGDSNDSKLVMVAVVVWCASKRVCLLFTISIEVLPNLAKPLTDRTAN
jgi:hypothetical protein